MRNPVNDVVHAFPVLFHGPQRLFGVGVLSRQGRSGPESALKSALHCVGLVRGRATSAGVLTGLP